MLEEKLHILSNYPQKTAKLGSTNKPCGIQFVRNVECSEESRGRTSWLSLHLSDQFWN